MRIVYYIYPEDFADYSVVVSDHAIVRNCDVAIMLDEGDRNRPYFFISLENGELTVEPTQSRTPQFLYGDESNMEMVVPLSNVNEAAGWVKHVTRKVAELADQQERWA